MSYLVKTATIFLTQNCNFNCHHCLNNCPYDDEMSLLEFKKVTEILVDRGLEYVIFTGGEPTVHQNFREIIEYTVDMGLEFKIISNGYLYEKYTPWLINFHPDNLRKISFSIEGFEVLHDNNRVLGSFAKVIEAIKVYKEYGVHVGVNLTVTKKSYSEFDDLIKYLSELDIDEIHVGSVIKNDKNSDLILNYEERENIFQRIPLISEHFQIKISLGSSLHNLGGIEFCKLLGSYTNIYINQKSQMLYCCNIKEPLGRISDEKIFNENLDKLIKIRNEITTKIRDDRLINNLENDQMDKFEYTCDYCQRYF